MKSFIKRVFLLLSLAIALSGILKVAPFGRVNECSRLCRRHDAEASLLRLGLGANLVFANDPSADNKPKCQLKSETGDAIPSSFSVGDCLVAPGQEESKFVPKKDQPNVPGTTTVASAVVATIDLLVKLIASLALIIFILGALLTITSEGKEDRLEKGKTAMFYALIGLVIAGFSFIIVTFVQSVLF